jgi:hypothetical protein
LVRAWKRSGLGASAFAALHGVAPGTLSWWRWRLRTTAATPTAPPAVGLVELQVEPERSSATEVSPAWELLTAAGHTLRVHGEIAEADLAAVLAALQLAGVRR